MVKVDLKVKGMHCTACEMLIKEILEDAGAKNVKCSFKGGSVALETTDKLPEAKAKELIIAEGYTVE